MITRSFHIPVQNFSKITSKKHSSLLNFQKWHCKIKVWISWIPIKTFRWAMGFKIVSEWTFQHQTKILILFQTKSHNRCKLIKAKWWRRILDRTLRFLTIMLCIQSISRRILSKMIRCSINYKCCNSRQIWWWMEMSNSRIFKISKIRCLNSLRRWWFRMLQCSSSKFL